MAASWSCVALSLLLSRLVSGGFVTSCGGKLTEPRGYIQTPNFPNRFPIPISCEWVIHAPPDNKIVIYFTQFYVKKSFTMSEYDYFESSTTFKGKNILGEVHFEDALTSMTAYKPYVVVEFKVRDHNNLHLRVEEYLQDVYGFNITYETLPLTVARRHSCSVDQCSYLGNCVANHDYSEYRCECFANYSGTECQYGPYCNPTMGLNQCENNGQCRYFYGSMVNTCVCLPGYDGVKCQIKKKRHFHSVEVKSLMCLSLLPKCVAGCSDRYERTNSGVSTASAVLVSAFTCAMLHATYRVDFLMRLHNDSSSQMLENPDKNPGPVRFITSKFIRHFIRANFTTVTDANFDGIRLINDRRMLCFHLLMDDSELDKLRRQLHDLVFHASTLLQHDLANFFGIYIYLNQTEVSFYPDAKLLYVDTFDQQPALEGALLTINCAAKGSQAMVFRWYKDGSLLDTSLSNRNAWQIHIPTTIDGKQTNVLNIDGVTFYDKGKFTCEITDFNRSQTDSVVIDVVTYPLLDLRPLSQSVVKGESLSFRCLSSDDTQGTFDYNWLKDGVPLSAAHHEVVEKVQPTGERLLIKTATRSTSYTCVITNTAGSSRKTAYVFVADENTTTAYCPEQIIQGTTWARTLGGHFDIQHCPIDTGGYSRRNCKCVGVACQWQKPNFAKCQSGLIVHLFDKVGISLSTSV
ncbi:uncharacterized protein LOC121376360 [Gigantopelta aegis]|uniref:uncharacterized protein LOC121376360 n=1 Tax=Gigantopelta aegis TaxID=1735272 RepID=UPI001B888CAD|nr:uncharacterized protein LOC121376360 [Gigantopelta aegis]